MSYAIRFWILLVLAVGLSCGSAPALTLNITYDSSVTSQSNAAQIESAFATAAQLFQTQFTNAITVNITVYWGATGPFSGGIGLGASQTQFMGTYLYADVTNALNAHRVSTADYSSVASL